MKNQNVGMKTLAVVSIALSLLACSSKEEAKTAETEEKEVVAVPVEVTQVERGDISAIYGNTMALEAEEEATVVAKTSEIITEIYVEEGDRVVKGQKLAQLNTDKLRLELKQAQANLGRLKAELERNRRIYEKQMVSSDTYERLKFEYEAQQASFDLATLQLEYATITAPINGVIAKRFIKEGNMVNVRDSLFHISDFEPLLAVIHVPEGELTKLSVNQTALIQMDADPNQQYFGRVKRISPVIDATSGTFKVTVEVNDPTSRLKPGMFGRVGIVYANKKDVLILDKNALIADEDKPTVFLVTDGKAEKTVIHTGYDHQGKIEVTDGLSFGDQVVVAGQNSLKQNTKVEILNQKSTNAEPSQVAASDL